MLTLADLRRLSRMRLRDAEALREAGRYDGAVYVCGYAVELALKARACRALHWNEFPSTSGEFRTRGLGSFQTHNLEVLLRLSGSEERIRTRVFAEWSLVLMWNPEARYSVGPVTAPQCADMINSSRRVIRELAR